MDRVNGEGKDGGSTCIQGVTGGDSDLFDSNCDGDFNNGQDFDGNKILGGKDCKGLRVTQTGDEDVCPTVF